MSSSVRKNCNSISMTCLINDFKMYTISSFLTSFYFERNNKNMYCHIGFFSESEGLLHFEFRYLQLLYDDVFWAIQSFNSKYSSELPTHEAQIVTFNTIRSLEMIDFIKGTLKVGSVLIRNQYVNRSFTFCHSRLHQFF